MKIIIIQTVRCRVTRTPASIITILSTIVGNENAVFFSGFFHFFFSPSYCHTVWLVVISASARFKRLRGCVRTLPMGLSDFRAEILNDQNYLCSSIRNGCTWTRDKKCEITRSALYLRKKYLYLKYVRRKRYKNVLILVSWQCFKLLVRRSRPTYIRMIYIILYSRCFDVTLIRMIKIQLLYFHRRCRNTSHKSSDYTLVDLWRNNRKYALVVKYVKQRCKVK